MPPPDPTTGIRYGDDPPEQPFFKPLTPEQKAADARRNRRFVIGLLIVLAVGGWWYSGNLDEVLYKVHLNKNPCVVSVFGSAVCGDQADRLCAEEIMRAAPGCEALREGY